jgi:hypothetical protein
VSCIESEEDVEPEVEPAQRADRDEDGDERRPGRHQHERHAPEEEDRDDAAGDEADEIVDDAVALDGIVDLELHHRHAGELRLQAGAGEILRHSLADLGDDAGRFRALGDVGLQRQHDQSEFAVRRDQLAVDEFVGADLLDEVGVGLAVRQRLGKERRRNRLAGRRRLAGGEHRDDAPLALDQLQVRDEVADLLRVGALEQLIAGDDDEHIVLAGGKLARHLLVLLELRRVRSKELRQRIVDLEPLQAEDRPDSQDDEDDTDEERRLERDQSHPLGPEGQLRQTPIRCPGAGLRRLNFALDGLHRYPFATPTLVRPILRVPGGTVRAFAQSS